MHAHIHTVSESNGIIKNYADPHEWARKCGRKKKGGTCIYYFFSNVPRYISTDIMTVVLQE